MNIYTPEKLAQIQQELPYLTEIYNWTKEFLAAPHPELGRSGAVCPFVPKALSLNAIRFTVVRTQGLSLQQIEEQVSCYRDLFLSYSDKADKLSVFNAMMLIFPDVSADAADGVIDIIQEKLKPFFIEVGLMIGEFHPFNQTPGLHNPDFRPLRSPIPMLAIRYLHESDLPFLNRPSDSPQRRIQYLEAYLKQAETWVDNNPNQLKAAQNSLAFAKSELHAVDIPVSIPQPASLPSRCPFKKLFGR